MPPTRSQQLRSAPGFSLVELTLVLVIVAAFSAIALPRWNNSTTRYRVDSAARRVMADFEYARLHAIATSQTLRVEFYPVDDLYILGGVRDLRANGSTYSLVLNAEPYRVDLLSASFGGNASVQFDHFGRPSSGGTVVVQIGTTRRTVTLNATTGRSSMS
jgi:prepilin-type N-terminal cleavage/methylation domain-containing protein